MNQPSENLPAVAGTTSRDLVAGAEIEHTAELAINSEAARVQAEIQAMIVTAHRFPRDTRRAAEQLGLMCRRPAFAVKAYYSYPRAGVDIRGPSVWLARQAGAIYGNITSGFRVLRDDGESVLVEGFAWDVQHNSKTIQQAEFKLLIKRSGKWIKPDERDKRELINKHAAIAERNCLLHILPVDYIDDAYVEAQKTAKKGASDRQASINSVQTYFAEYGVGIDQLEQWLANERGVDTAPINSLTEDNLADLRGIYNALKEGEVTVNQVFNFAAKPPPTTEPKPSKEKVQPHDKAPGGEEPPPPKKMSAAGRKTLIKTIEDLALKIVMGDASGACKLIDKCAGGGANTVLSVLHSDELKKILERLEIEEATPDKPDQGDMLPDDKPKEH